MDFEVKDSILEEEKETHIVKIVVSAEEKTHHTNLKMIMLNSSLNHAYTQLEYEKTDCLMKQEELSIRMEALRDAYFHARKKLWNEAPQSVVDIEADLEAQKREFFHIGHHA
ncbi:MAG: hypothetical protein A3I75_00950 [Deltaproteobacteria bacterium RIFCSPLOWO2_02_FULL_50_16]|nr:MAG: hypothetical protein A2053_05500 [Deltaproteobacteria bacterium GWA2_50_8]OGQ30229.1 MAG: hypothetical protein A3B79_02315 [Deltaproteobacteria bacterium RIFCSPHIGHO2_02_FULL_50_15]OGQ55866.1 MAG: hypothetical protein A3I75_00950 [Deltaproteobacteria bacterium RIFCSPLOWO2_02_FULL_50_16]OGQ66934.1 MAG: hypothetical protein A3F89_08120 [Deltaproteobacteria bacterium RIFCSPLOWO2_12_FULL_50_11]